MSLIENAIEQLNRCQSGAGGGEALILLRKVGRIYQPYRADQFRLIYQIEKMCVYCDGIASATKHSKALRDRLLK
jgi:hypothetical protein